ncbi:uncharacterized protein LOC129786241 [Lutzomyia longipalpis]|uniref:Uncharacterized protein n=2 Tax=Lutzomyia longipalpis TaxID=7200 RepID=A0A1B0CC66_LUTLO|nr:uncharacterized protein LOC129786241 [Lutzomyia longipalpis]
MKSVISLIVPCFLAVLAVADDELTGSPLYCQDLNPQSHLDIEQIMGLWYGSEIYTHHDNEERELVYNSCVVIHLGEVTNEMITTERSPRPGEYGYGNTYRGRNSRQNYRYLKLIWDEREKTLEYTMRLNASRRGFWITSAPQGGGPFELEHGTFSGTVQVMKAVGDHLVLTFCQHFPSGTLFSIVLSRQPNTLTFEDIQSVRNLLKRRGLPTTNVRKVCRNGSRRLEGAFSGTILLLLATLPALRKFLVI